MVTLAKKLGVESKWIVTGTPTSKIPTTTLLIDYNTLIIIVLANLMGLKFGEASELQCPDDDEESPKVSILLKICFKLPSQLTLF